VVRSPAWRTRGPSAGVLHQAGTGVEHLAQDRVGNRVRQHVEDLRPRHGDPARARPREADLHRGLPRVPAVPRPAPGPARAGKSARVLHDTHVGTASTVSKTSSASGSKTPRDADLGSRPRSQYVKANGYTPSAPPGTLSVAGHAVLFPARCGAGRAAMQVPGGRARVYARGGARSSHARSLSGIRGVDRGFSRARKAGREAMLDSRTGGVAHGIPRDHDHSHSGWDV
jgi:hypothetical protein